MYSSFLLGLFLTFYQSHPVVVILFVTYILNSKPVLLSQVPVYSTLKEPLINHDCTISKLRCMKKIVFSCRTLEQYIIGSRTIIMLYTTIYNLSKAFASPILLSDDKLIKKQLCIASLLRVHNSTRSLLQWIIISGQVWNVWCIRSFEEIAIAIWRIWSVKS